MVDRLKKFHPSSFTIAILIMGLSIFFLGGGVYDIINQPRAILSLGSSFLAYIPYQIHEQLLMGSIGVMILYILGTAGLLLIYRSTRYMRNPNQVSLVLRIGIILLLISFVAVEAVLFSIMNYNLFL
jgi:hypothetical protein